MLSREYVLLRNELDGYLHVVLWFLTHPKRRLGQTKGRGSFSKEPPHALQHAVLVRVVGMVFGGYLEERGESGRVCLDSVPYALCNLPNISQTFYNTPTTCQFRARTCWFMSRIAISFRSWVKRSKAASMSAV